MPEKTQKPELQHPRNIAEQIEWLASLPDGWLDGAGKAVNRQGLAWLRHALRSKINFDHATMPYLYPTEEGNVQAEWNLGNTAADMEINLTTRQAVWGESKLDTGHNAEHTINLNEETGWQWLKTKLDHLTYLYPSRKISRAV